MRTPVWALRRYSVFLLCLLGLAACGGRPVRPDKWQVGFWYWEGGSGQAKNEAAPVDLLYLKVSEISGDLPSGSMLPRIFENLPEAEEVPRAKAYWLVYRFNLHVVPPTQLLPALQKSIERARNQALRRGYNVAGVQLDIDCPTGALGSYAVFLRQLKPLLPANFGLSITALLDWFRQGTSIGEVVTVVDEFVPQFYDLNQIGRAGNQGPSIAARIDAAKWGPRFSAYRKPFRIGISTFGRSRLVPAPKKSSTADQSGVTMYQDLTLPELALNPNLKLQASRTDAGEHLLRYELTRRAALGYTEFPAKTVFEVILASPESIRAATDQAMQMGEHCLGVVFFRWPTVWETMMATPAEVMAADGQTTLPSKPVAIRAINRKCAVVECHDLYLVNIPRLHPNAFQYRIESQSQITYFIPQERLPVQMTGPKELQFTLPAFIGRGQLYLGRAVSEVKLPSNTWAFRLQERP